MVFNCFLMVFGWFPIVFSRAAGFCWTPQRQHNLICREWAQRYSLKPQVLSELYPAAERVFEHFFDVSSLLKPKPPLIDRATKREKDRNGTSRHQNKKEEVEIHDRKKQGYQRNCIPKGPNTS